MPSQVHQTTHDTAYQAAADALKPYTLPDTARHRTAELVAGSIVRQWANAGGQDRMMHLCQAGPTEPVVAGVASAIADADDAGQYRISSLAEAVKAAAYAVWKDGKSP